MAEVISNYEIRESHDPKEARFSFLDTTHLVSPTVSTIPWGGNVQATRLFYGNRFLHQAQGMAQPESPIVQTLAAGEKDTSIDDLLGRRAGAVFTDDDGVIEDVQDDSVTWRDSKGQERKVPLYRNFPFNRYSGLNQAAAVKKGDAVKRGGLLARSNYTDDKGTLAMGLNARIGLVPYKGHSMDDAIVISDAFAKRATSQHVDTLQQDFSQGDLRPGRDHFLALFPEMFTKDQLSRLDDDGVVQPGQTINPGDPLVLATRPRSFHSAQQGQLTRTARELRAAAPLKWDFDEPGKVLDVARAKDGTVKVVVESLRPTKKGDKLAMRSGQKSIVSLIIPEQHMPRTMDGKPLEVLLNPLSVPSRANPELPFEILLGKVAAATGKKIKLPWFSANNQSSLQLIRKMLADNGLTDKDEVFDPQENRKLETPITTGIGYVMKLHHIAEKKMNSRGQGGYDINEAPTRGSGPSGGAKRVSGLETVALLSSGATNVLGEASTIRGQKSEDFWRTLRAGGTPKMPGSPFVFHKFKALLNGAGLHAREISGDRTRLGFMTDKILEKYKPMELRHGGTVDYKTLDPEPGGLFDPALVGASAWGKITLDEPMPNPAAETMIRGLLGLTKQEFESILSGKSEFQD